MLDNIIKESNSLEIQRYITKMITRPSAHEHTHILYDIVTLLGLDGRKVDYLEIGSYIGSSACLVEQNTYTSSITCIEARKDFSEIVIDNLKKLNKHNIQYLDVHNYRSTDPNVLNLINLQSFDLIFIDGDHSYNGVMNDFNNYIGLLKKGGYMVFDDYLDSKYSPGVKPAVDDIVIQLSNTEFEIIGTPLNYQNAKTKYDIGKYMNEFIIKKI